MTTQSRTPEAQEIYMRARNGTLGQLATPLQSRKMLTQLLLVKGSTALWEAANVGKLKEFPQQVLSREAFTKANRQGYAPLHRAALSGVLGDVPEEYLTPEDLNILTRFGETVVGCAKRNPQSREFLRDLSQRQIATQLDNLSGDQTDTQPLESWMEILEQVKR